MKSSSPQERAPGQGQRHWFRITGLPGWRRAQLGLPTFGDSNCSPAANPKVRSSRRHLADEASARTRGARVRPNFVCRVPAKNQSGITWHELRAHMPFTVLGALSGALVLGLLIWTQAPRSFSVTLFWTFHPLHVLFSALVTTAMFRRYGGRGLWQTIAVGYCGSIGIATLSDSLLPYAGEWLLALPHRGLHLGFIEKWWLVNPLAFSGILIGSAWPHTRFPHAGHMLLSTWASLFHITMALGVGVSLTSGALIVLFLFLAVWLPCCTSDIIFPLLFVPKTTDHADRPAAASRRP